MGIDKNTMFFYVICLIIALGGFSLILLTRNTLIFVAGVILALIGPFLFLIVREKTKKAAKQG
jgi:uncharacterized membrane protein